MSYNIPDSSSSQDKVSTAILNQINVDAVFVKVLPVGNNPNVVYRIGDDTIHPEGWDNVEGEQYLDFYVSSGAQGEKGDKGDDGLGAYEQAVIGGYTGTPEEFYALLTEVTDNALLAEASMEAAAISETNAGLSATASGVSATASDASATASSGYASNSSDSAIASEASSVSANNSAGTATAQASASSNSATASSGFADDSEASSIASASSASDSSTTATNSANSATASGTSATNAELFEWEAEAERLTATSYAIEAEDVLVNIVTSDGDGTFTYTPQVGIYSSLHYEAKSAGNTATTATDVTTDTTNFNNILSAADSDVQKALDTLDDLTISNVSTEASSILLNTDSLSMTYEATATDVTTTTADYALTDYIYDTSSGILYDCILASTTGVLLTNATYFTAVTVNTLSITAGNFTYTNGKSQDGYVRTSEQVTGSIDFAGVSNGLKWIAKVEGGSYSFYDEKPILTPNGDNVWFNAEDGFHYQSSFIADGSTNTPSEDATPVMTSNTSPSGVASASSIDSGLYDAWYAMNNIVSGAYGWQSSVGTTGWWKYQSESAFACNKVIITASVDGTRTPKDFTLEFSTTGLFAGEEDVVKTVTSETGWSANESREFTFSNDVSHGYFKVNITAVDGASNISIQDIKFVKAEVQNGTQLPTPISFLKNPYMVASETPQYRDDTQELSESVMESLETSGDITAGGEFKGVNVCTVWVNFDGTTTPPTIRDSFNVSDVVRTATGIFDIYFEEDMGNIGYALIGGGWNATLGVNTDNIALKQTNKVTISFIDSGGNYVSKIDVGIQIIGGKN